MKLLANYEDICDPDTYGKPPPSRRRDFALEQRLLRSQQAILASHRRRFNDMLDECEALGQFVIHATEIEKDDLNKTILAFTIVTIIFLPLSFVTSFLGMNTTLDGNWQQTQDLFWEIALPLTFALSMFCLLLAFWEKTTTWIRELFIRVSPLPAKLDAPSPVREAPPMDEKLRRRVTFADDSNSMTEEV